MHACACVWVCTCMRACHAVCLSVSLSRVCLCVSVHACVSKWMRAYVYACYLMLLLFLAKIVICLNIFSFCILLTVIYHTFNLNFYSFTCYTDGMFESKFPFKDNKVPCVIILYSCNTHQCARAHTHTNARAQTHKWNVTFINHFKTKRARVQTHIEQNRG